MLSARACRACARARCPARPSRRDRRADGAAPCLREDFEPWPTRRGRRRPFRPLGHAQSGRGRRPATLAVTPAATSQGEAPAGGTADQWPMRRTWKCQRSSRLTSFPDASARSHLHFAEPRGWAPAGRSGAASSGPGGSVGGFSQSWEDSITRRESSRQRSQCDTSARAASVKLLVMLRASNAGAAPQNTSAFGRALVHATERASHPPGAEHVSACAL